MQLPRLIIEHLFLLPFHYSSLFESIRVGVRLSSGFRVEDQGNDQTRIINEEHNYVRDRGTDPYRPKTSAKIRINTIPTNILDCDMYDRTPISPTIPIAYPAARPVSPTQRPHARCMNPLNLMSACYCTCLPRLLLE